MPPNEYTALVNNRYESTYTTFDNYNDRQHTVHINKDLTEYESVFSLNEFPSSLTLDELLVFKEDPFWQKMHFILFYAFWLALIITFLIACLITYLEFDFNTCNAMHISGSPSTTISTTFNVDRSILSDLPLLTVH
uniref:Solute carrier family 3 member 2 N-terminal domain-containing protein n=1 Tax=Glossina morsitans morsitans TaxID=37546 RepID=A0A1B0G9D8_GLOMM